MKKVIVLFLAMLFLSCDLNSYLNDFMRRAIDYYFEKEGEVDKKHISLFEVNRKIYSGNSKTNWTTFETASYSSIQPIVVIFRYYNKSLNDVSFSLREYESASINTIYIGPDDSNSVFMITDKYGRLQWKTDSTNDCEIYFEYFLR